MRRAVHGFGRKSTLMDRHAWRREPICLRIYVDWRRAIRRGTLMGPRMPKPHQC
jgi:hypothetical protein